MDEKERKDWRKASRLTKAGLGNLIAKRLKEDSLSSHNLVLLAELLIDIRGWKSPQVKRRYARKANLASAGEAVELHDMVLEIEQQKGAN